MAVDKAFPLCAHLGVSVTLDELQGPTSTTMFLSTELDSVQLEVWLLQTKLHQLQDLLGL